jgi:nitrogen fixation protein NifU and related proteins
LAQKQSLYDEVVMDHIKNVRNYRSLNEASHAANGINPLCGDTFSVHARVEAGVVRDAAFQCECCGISMASASIMTELVTGRSVEQAQGLVRDFTALLKGEVTPQDAAIAGDALAIVALIRQSPSRLNCARLAWVTLEAALAGRSEAVLGV